MSYTTAESSDIRGRFVFIAQELSCRFPQLDLRFNLQSGSSTLRLMVPQVSPRKVIELNLAKHETDELLYSAIFRIKELARIFDA